METSEQLSEIAAALCKAQAMINGAAKDKTNPHYKSKYADLSSVWEACRAALTSNGLGVVQMTRHSDKDEVIVVTRLIHSSGQWMQGELNLPVSRADAQGFGSALTYARRYALAAAVGVAPEDDDGQLAVAAKPNGAGYEKHTARQVAVDAFDSQSSEEQAWLKEQAIEIIAIAEGNGDLHKHIEGQRYDTEQKLALWSLLPSNVRSAIKKQQTAARLGSQA